MKAVRYMPVMALICLAGCHSLEAVTEVPVGSVDGRLVVSDSEVIPDELRAALDRLNEAVRALPVNDPEFEPCGASISVSESTDSDSCSPGEQVEVYIFPDWRNPDEVIAGHGYDWGECHPCARWLRAERRGTIVDMREGFKGVQYALPGPAVSIATSYAGFWARGAEDGSVHIGSLDPGAGVIRETATISNLTTPPYLPTQMAWLTDRYLVVEAAKESMTVQDEGYLHVVDTRTGRITSTLQSVGEPHVLPDGRVLAERRRKGESTPRMVLIEIDGAGEVSDVDAWRKGRFHRLSPNGRFVELWVTKFPAIYPGLDTYAIPDLASNWEVPPAPRRVRVGWLTWTPESME